MTAKLRIMLLPLLLACSSKAVVTVNLETSSVDGLDPYAPAVGLAKVRLSLDGPNQLDDTAVELDLDTRVAKFEGFVDNTTARLRIEGFDDAGNIVAFGGIDELDVTGEVERTVPFRRNLAYVAHFPSDAQQSPQSHIYLLDLSSRTLVSKIKLPGTAPVALGVSARGGRSILVPYADSGLGFLGVLDASTNTWESVPLMRAQQLALASPDSDVAIVAGGGVIAFVNLVDRTIEETPLRGNVLDGAISSSGDRALFVLDTSLVEVDVPNRSVRALDVGGTPSGLAVGLGGRVAYVTSSDSGQVVAIDLQNGRTNIQGPGTFARPVQQATYSEIMQAVLGLHVTESSKRGRVLSFVVPSGEGLSFDRGPDALVDPTGIATGAGGRRLIVVSAGTSSASAGLTVIDTFSDRSPIGSKGLYPVDPDDSRVSSTGIIIRERYRPRAVAVIYGR